MQSRIRTRPTETHLLDLDNNAFDVKRVDDDQSAGDLSPSRSDGQGFREGLVAPLEGLAPGCKALAAISSSSSFPSHSLRSCSFERVREFLGNLALDANQVVLFKVQTLHRS